MTGCGVAVQAPASLVREHPEALGPYARPVELEPPLPLEDEGSREQA